MKIFSKIALVSLVGAILVFMPSLDRAGVPTGDTDLAGPALYNYAAMASANPFTPANFSQIGTGKSLQIVNGEGIFPVSKGGGLIRWMYNGPMQSDCTSETPAGCSNPPGTAPTTVLRAKIEIGAYNVDDYIFAWVGDSTGEGYALQINDTNIALEAMSASGTTTSLKSTNVSSASVGDIFELEYISSTHTLNAYQNGTLIPGMSLTDSTYNPIYFGFAFSPQNTNGSGIAAFAGDGSAQPVVMPCNSLWTC